MNSEEYSSLEPENLETNSSTESEENLSEETILEVQPQLPDKEELTQEIERLTAQKQSLEAEIKALEASKTQIFSQTLQEMQKNLSLLVDEATKDLEQRKQTLEISLEQLERRQERIKAEMRTTFAGTSQELAIRIQGFKDYLVGSLQDLAATAEELELPSFSSRDQPQPPPPTPPEVTQTNNVQFAQKSFEEELQQIRKTLEQYRTRPDYYGPAWQLRRTFEPIHAERVQKWFVSQGGRGAIKTMGSRLQNILIASAIISVLHKLYGDRLRTLLLANTPERLGEWRRGLQDCLGISRSDFGPNQGVVLFESPEALAQKAERIEQEKEIPLVIIDETENQISLSLLQFPLWLAFAPEPQLNSNYLY